MAVASCCVVLLACQGEGRLSSDSRRADPAADVGEADVSSGDDDVRTAPDVDLGITPDTNEGDPNESVDLADTALEEDTGPTCEVATLMPPALQGDLELTLANSSDVVAIGMGYDMRRGELLQECVTGVSARSEGEDVIYEFRELETRAEMSQALAVDVAVSIGFMGFGFTNRFSMARSRDVSIYDLNIWVRVRVETASEAFVSDVALRPEFEEMIGTDPFEFLERCGERFVQSVSFGGELLMLLSVSTESEADRRELENRLTARFGLFGSVEVGVANAFEEAFEGREVTIQVSRTGGGGSLPPMSTAAELFDYARQFPEEVANNEPVAFRYVTRPYDRIIDGEICLPGFDPKSIRLIEEAWELLNELIGVRNALEDAVGDPNEYACGNNRERRAALAYVEQYLEDLETLAQNCAGDMSNPRAADRTAQSCNDLEALMRAYEEPDIPLRWQHVLTFEASPLERYASFFLSETLACRPLRVDGLWSQWSRNNSCPNPDICWQACPVGTLDGTEYQLEFDDGNLSDNRGNCTYTFGCMEAEDAYLLEACSD